MSSVFHHKTYFLIFSVPVNLNVDRFKLDYIVTNLKLSQKFYLIKNEVFLFFGIFMTCIDNILFDSVVFPLWSNSFLWLSKTLVNISITYCSRALKYFRLVQVNGGLRTLSDSLNKLEIFVNFWERNQTMLRQK